MIAAPSEAQKVADIDHLLNFPPAFLNGFAHFAGDQLTEGLFIGAQLNFQLCPGFP
jgi:hypothetical protein